MTPETIEPESERIIFISERTKGATEPFSAPPPPTGAPIMQSASPPPPTGQPLIPASRAPYIPPTGTIKRAKNSFRPEETALRRLLKVTGKRILVFSVVMAALVIGAYLFQALDSWIFNTNYYGGASGLGWLPMISSDFIAVFVVPWLIGVVLIAWYSWLHREHPDGTLYRGLSKAQLRKSIQKRYRRKFWISFVLLTAVVVLVVFAFLILKDSQIWYGTEPLYDLLSALKNMFPYAILAVWMGGTIILLFSQWKQSASDIVALVDSIEQMQTSAEGSRIETPRNLPELAPVLQGMFDESCEDKRRAREAEQKKNDLILYLAHDLKTPLTSVVGYLNLLKDSDELTEEQKEKYTKIAWEKSLRLEDLIEQFFEISRFSLAETELKRETFSLNFLLLQLVDEFYPLLNEQGREVALEVDDNLEVNGDADLLARVFNNLLRNAIAYSYPCSTIKIGAYCEGARVVISFANRGEDIPAEQLSQLFDKFFRLDEARASETGGAGLGLAIAKEIVLRHGGTIEATSFSNETVFTVRLPLMAIRR